MRYAQRINIRIAKADRSQAATAMNGVCADSSCRWHGTDSMGRKGWEGLRCSSLCFRDTVQGSEDRGFKALCRGKGSLVTCEGCTKDGQLWMGTHPSNPSKDVETQRTLLDLVQDNQALMSSAISSRYGNKLPFLFKVLSINKALSIQAHPNKKLAEKLHAKDSKNYPDDNHKPEMTIAITPFDGLCGFRPLAEISHFLDTVPSFRGLVGEEAAQKFQSAVKGKEDAGGDDASANKKALQSA